jgi:hypothetical protein
MSQEKQFKKGQSVVVSHRGQEPVAGHVVAVHPGSRGSFVEVKHVAEDKTKKYRPVAVTPV